LHPDCFPAQIRNASVAVSEERKVLCRQKVHNFENRKERRAVQEVLEYPDMLHPGVWDDSAI